MAWEYLEHQKVIAEEAEAIIRENAIVYLSMEERTGKSGTVIRMCENLRPHFILIITKKRAIEGWQEHLDNLPTKKNYTIINYEMVHKVQLDKYQLIVLDEAHANLSMFPKPGKRWKDVEKLTRGKPLAYLSATPSAQSYSQLFNQLALSTWSPWRHFPNFYKWFEHYGVPKSKFISGRTIIDYSETREDRVMNDVKHLFISYTRKELGFLHEPKDILHTVELHPKLVELQREMTKKRFIDSGHEILRSKNEWVGDTPMKHLTALHQLEGGTLKINDQESIILDDMFLVKIHYILNKWGDEKNNVIFYHYKQEEHLLKKWFKNSRILQATSFAEGVDLHTYDNLIVYSMDFSTARYSQRRARQANIKRKDAINVHFILVKKGISEQVYDTVALKKANFVDSYFEGI